MIRPLVAIVLLLGTVLAMPTRAPQLRTRRRTSSLAKSSDTPMAN